MPTITTNEATLYYEVYGTGRPLVFLHGRGGNTLIWWQQVDFFAREYRCILVDQRGWGRSSGLLPEPWVEAFVPDLHLVLAELGVKEFAVVAQSMGGGTVNAFGAAYPGRIRAAVLSGTTGGFVAPPARALYQAASAQTDAARSNWVAQRGQHPAAGPRLYVEQPALARLYEMISALNQPPRVAPDSGPPQAERQALHLPKAALFIYGDEDTLCPPALIEATAATLPGSTLHRVAQSGHSPYFERAAEFNGVVSSFLSASYVSALS